MAADNMTLGKFRLEGLPPAPRGIPQIEVTFDIDANGILNVKAVDKATGKEQKIAITASTNLNKGEIDRMVRESEQNAEADRERKALIEARNLGDNLVYQAEKSLRELDGKVEASLKAEVETKVADLKKAMEGDDKARIVAASEALQQTMSRIGQAAYQQAGASANGHAAASDSEKSGKDENVVEGEFSEA
jgi:molecular chaperone DnaK